MTVFKLVNNINIDNTKYNPEEIFINFNLFKNDEEPKINLASITNCAFFYCL